MRVLIIGAHSTRNAGDAALTEMAVQTVRSVLPEAQITLSITDTDLGESRTRLEDVEVIESFSARFSSSDGRSHWRAGAALGVASSLAFAVAHRLFGYVPRSSGGWRSLWAAYATSTKVVLCPGNILANTGRLGLPLLVAGWTIAFALLLNKPVYVLPQSIGPFRRRWEIRLMRSLYSRARIVMVREPISLDVILRAGVSSRHIYLIPDLAYAYTVDRSLPIPPIITRIRDCPRPIIGITVVNRLLSTTDSAIWEKYERSVAIALSEFLREHGGTAVFFPQVVGPTEREDDRIASRRIAAMMAPCCDQVVVVDDWLGPMGLMEAYGLVDLFVATRMHSAIFATRQFVPTLFIEYLHKVRGLAQMLGLESYVIDLVTADAAQIHAGLWQLWEHRVTLREYLSAQVPPLVADARSAGRHLMGG